MHRRGSSDSETMSRPSRANVPFSWENSPGMSKVPHDRHDHKLSHHLNMEDLILKLTPPPRMSSHENGRGTNARFMVVDRQSRLPLCSIQPSFRLDSFRLGGAIVKKEEDPFLAAYLKCTAKNPSVHVQPSGNSGKKQGKKVKTMFSFSCKYSCAVKEDCIVRMP